MFALPASDSSLRDLFQVEDLLPFGTPQGRVQAVTFRQAAMSARRIIEADPAVRAVHAICVRAAGEVQLLRFGAKGGHRVLWTFGRI